MSVLKSNTEIDTCMNNILYEFFVFGHSRLIILCLSLDYNMQVEECFEADKEQYTVQWLHEYAQYREPIHQIHNSWLWPQITWMNTLPCLFCPPFRLWCLHTDCFTHIFTHITMAYSYCTYSNSTQSFLHLIIVFSASHCHFRCICEL